MLSVMRIGIGFSLLYDYLMAVVVSSVMGLDTVVTKWEHRKLTSCRKSPNPKGQAASYY